MSARALGDEFADRITRRGHTRVFRNVDGEEDAVYRRNGHEEDIYAWIKNIYHDSRGAELPGTVNPAVLQNLFRQQSSSWEAISTEYLEKAKAAIDAFNEAELLKLIPDDGMRNKLFTRLMESSSSAKSHAERQLQKLLSLVVLDEAVTQVRDSFAATLSGTTSHPFPNLLPMKHQTCARLR